MNNEYIKFNLKNITKNSIIIINEINEICPNSNSIECNITINQQLEFDEIRYFTLTETYQIVDNDNVIINLNFTPIDLSYNEMNDIISKIFINNILIDENKCSFNNNIVNCKIVNSGKYEVLYINYNEFEETNNKYSLLYYQFDGPSCIFEDTNNEKTYNLNVLNYPYLVYLNDKKLEKNEDNYILKESDFNYGENYIYYKQYELDNPIKIFSFNFYQKYRVTIVNFINEGGYSIKVINGIGIKIDNISSKNNIIDFEYIKSLVLNYNNTNKKINFNQCSPITIPNIFLCIWTKSLRHISFL